MLFLPALFALFVTRWSIRVLGNIVNPVALFSIGLAAPIFFTAVLDFLAQIWEIDFPVTLGQDVSNLSAPSFAYVVAILVFFLPWMLASKKIAFERVRLKSYLPISERSRLKKNILILSICILLLIGFAGLSMGGIPVVEMLMGSMDIRDSDQNAAALPLGMLSVITVGIMIIMLWAVSFFFDPQSGRHDWRKYLLFFIIFFPIIFWNGKRQNILFFMVVFGLKYLIEWSDNANFRRRYISPWKIFLLLSVVLVGTFVFVDAIRYQDTGQGASNSLIFLGYLTWPARNIISIYQNLGFGSVGDGFGDGFFTLAELVPARLGGKDLVLASGELLFEPTSPSGFLAYWWFDGGFLFSLFGVFVFSCFSLYVYAKRLMNPSWGRIYLLILWCCITSGIYTHFIALNYFWLPFTFFAIESVLIGKRRLR